MKKLHLAFKNDLGKAVPFKPSIARTDLTVVQVKEFMAGMIDLNLFEKDGNKKYVEAGGAKYVETTVTELF